MIQKIRIVGEVAIITADAEFHPLRQLKQLTMELNRMSFSGTVLFDLLAVNGLTTNRFSSMSFKNKKFYRETFSVEKDVEPNIKSKQDDLAKQDKTFLLGSVLSTTEVERFTH
ncbi:type II toxin-antitoxin system RnlB family antitoxin [Pseudoalteromonas rhizosphaerae]|uniref:Type II toxin-antitoxin system RnlB family antitoxin n=1 Tax=Pseudoalteromonas rhizosphaerae TaxID=2518973 RepID=A0ABW8L3B1_9GAMM